MTERIVTTVIGAPIDVLTWDQAVSRIMGWVAARRSKVVCICNAHSAVTTKTDPEFRDVLLQADMATADGAPIAFIMRRLGHPFQMRINGPDLMFKCCAEAAKSGDAIYLYGSTQETLKALKRNLVVRFPSLKIVGAYSPPFRELTAEEDKMVVNDINNSGAGIVWVGLGCPKQEKWMAAQRGRVNAVMIGIGAAFDYHAGTIKRAPHWMQRSGFEWLHRLVHEPRRLWRRYLVTNSLFIWYGAIQLMRPNRDLV